MFNIEAWQEILGTIQKNKLRTFLTSVSVSSGIFILVILLGVGKGMQNGIESAFAEDAVNNIWVWTGLTSEPFQGMNAGRRIQIENSDFHNLVRSYGNMMDEKTPVVRKWEILVTHQEKATTCRIEGIFSDFQLIENNSLLMGRYINDNDVKNVEKIAVIGNKIKKDLFEKGVDPIHSYIKVGTILFKVVGVYADAGGEREEDRIYIPFSTSQVIFNAQNKINILAFNSKMTENLDESVANSAKLTRNILNTLKKRHKVAPKDTSAIEIHDSLEVAKRFHLLSQIMHLFFWLVGICTIIAGIVGVSNIMFIVVKERTKEIGIRKALGAKPINIVGMIMHESVFITAVSGFTGLIFSLSIWEFIGPNIQSEFFKNPGIDFWTALNTVIVLIIAGSCAGFFPAYKASRIKPVDALKDE